MSLFGEILEPGSRSAWEDWDEAERENGYLEIKWENTLEVPDIIDLLIILDGQHITDTVRLQAQDSIELVNTVKEASLSLYKIKLRNAYICVLRNYDILLTTEIVELLGDFVEKSKDILMLLKKPVGEYQTSNLASQNCIIRTLTTTKIPENTYGFDFPKLEQPNIVSGVAAGVLTWREHLDLTATVVVYYLEILESTQMEQIKNLLRQFDVSVATNPAPGNITNSNLYI